MESLKMSHENTQMFHWLFIDKKNFKNLKKLVVIEHTHLKQ